MSVLLYKMNVYRSENVKQLNGAFKWIFDMGNWLFKFIYLHTLWIIFSILGLGVFGIFPATASVFTVARKWLEEGEDVPIFQTFFHSYKSIFFQASGLGYMMTALGLFFAYDFMISREYIELVVIYVFLIFILFLFLLMFCYCFFFLYVFIISREYIELVVIHVFLIFILFLFVLTVCYIFPVYVRYNLRFFMYIKQSLLVALARPLESIGMLLSILLLYYMLIL